MGQARAGKDTWAEYIAKKYGFVRIGLADPMKRFCQDVFDFNDKQMWGDERDKPDLRYIRKENVSLVELEDARFMRTIEKVIDQGLKSQADVSRISDEISVEDCRYEYLTPRFALQTLGTEWGRACYQNVWIDYGIRIAKKLVEDPYAHYDPKSGLAYGGMFDKDRRGVVFSDLRFRNEFDAVKNAGGKMVRVIRPSLADHRVGIQGHASEEEQKRISDDEFDFIVKNETTIPDYHVIIDVVMGQILK